MSREEKTWHEEKAEREKKREERREEREREKDKVMDGNEAIGKVIGKGKRIGKVIQYEQIKVNHSQKASQGYRVIGCNKLYCNWTTLLSG